MLQGSFVPFCAIGTARTRNAHVKQESIPQTQCLHRLLSVVPIVSVLVEGGYAARCLLCGGVGPVRDNGQTARVALLEQEIRHRKIDLKGRVSSMH